MITLTAEQKRAAAKRVAERRAIDPIWAIILVLLCVTIIFTLLGWMDWSGAHAVKETAPVSIDAAVESGGLRMEDNGRK